MLRIKEASGVENDLDAVLTTLALFVGAGVIMAVVAVLAEPVAIIEVVALLAAIVLFAFGKVVRLASVEIFNGAWDDADAGGTVEAICFDASVVVVAAEAEELEVKKVSFISLVFIHNSLLLFEFNVPLGWVVAWLFWLVVTGLVMIGKLVTGGGILAWLDIRGVEAKIVVEAFDVFGSGTTVVMRAVETMGLIEPSSAIQNKKNLNSITYWNKTKN